MEILPEAFPVFHVCCRDVKYQCDSFVGLELQGLDESARRFCLKFEKNFRAKASFQRWKTGIDKSTAKQARARNRRQNIKGRFSLESALYVFFRICLKPLRPPISLKPGKTPFRVFSARRLSAGLAEASPERFLEAGPLGAAFSGRSFAPTRPAQGRRPRKP